MIRKLIYGLCTLVFISCNSDQEVLVQEKVAERVQSFKEKKALECMESLLQSAESRVDSLLLAEAQNTLNDSLTRLRPDRPYQPAAVLPIDSLKIKPIFDQIRPASSTGG